MNDHDPTTPDPALDPTLDDPALVATADRLRGALSARAGRVEPNLDGLTAIERRTEQRRREVGRRRALVSAAAAVLAATGVIGGVAALGGSDDEPRTEVAVGADPDAPAPQAPDTGGPGTEIGENANRTEIGPDGEELHSQVVTIWPLPSMSVSYADPTQAAMAFMTGYLGMDEGSLCPRDAELDGIGATVDVVHEGVCAPSGGGQPLGPSTRVDLVRQFDAWWVIGTESNAIELTTDPQYGPYTPVFDAAVTWESDAAGDAAIEPSGPARVELRPLSSMTPVWSGPTPVPGEPLQLTVDAGVVDDTRYEYALVVTDGVTAEVDIIYMGDFEGAG